MLLKQHCNLYRRGCVTPSMIWRETVKYDQFVMPDAFAKQLHMEQEIRETFKETIKNIIQNNHVYGENKDETKFE